MKRTLFFILVLASKALIAQPGSLDTIFGNQGKTILEVSSMADGQNKVAVQSHNKILVTTSLKIASKIKFHLSRLNEDGSIDHGFGDNGSVIVDLGGAEDFVRDLAVQDDDKIIVAGTSGDLSDRDFAIVRFMPDGTLDASFGNSGIVKRNNSTDDMIHAIEIQSDGKLVATGVSEGQVCLLRFNTDGTADTGFGSNGLVITSIGIYSTAYALCIQEDGKILSAGQTMDVTADGIIIRYNPNGSLDTSFGSSGTIVINSGENDYITSIKVQPDGKIVTGGAYGTYSASGVVLDFMVLRFLNNGDVDMQFNGTGKLTIDFDSSLDVGNDLLIDDENKILIAGYSSKDQKFDFALARINSNGTLDLTFGNGGKVKSDFGSYREIAQGIALYKNNRILVSGQWGNQNFPMVCCYYSKLSTNLVSNPKPSSIEAEISYRDENTLILKIQNTEKHKIRMAIFDVSGRLVLQGMVDPDFENLYSIDIRSLHNNKIYILQLSTYNHVLTFKILK